MINQLLNAEHATEMNEHGQQLRDTNKIMTEGIPDLDAEYAKVTPPQQIDQMTSDNRDQNGNQSEPIPQHDVKEELYPGVSDTQVFAENQAQEASNEPQENKEQKEQLDKLKLQVREYVGDFQKLLRNISTVSQTPNFYELSILPGQSTEEIVQIIRTFDGNLMQLQSNIDQAIETADTEKIQQALAEFRIQFNKLDQNVENRKKFMLRGGSGSLSSEAAQSFRGFDELKTRIQRIQSSVEV